MSEHTGAASHTHQPGWFDLVSVMMEGMLANAGKEEAEAFLYDMGDSLAARYPLPDARRADVRSGGAGGRRQPEQEADV